MAKVRKYKFVEVTWEDAVTYSGWKTEEALNEMVPDICVTTGWLLRRTDKHLIMAHTRSEEEFTGVVIIPAKWIVKVKKVTIG